jgi:hypothetical protein
MFVLTLASDAIAQGPIEPSSPLYRPFSGPLAAKTPQRKRLTLFPGVLPQNVVPPNNAPANRITLFSGALPQTALPPQATTTPCSVPLIEVEIPKDIHFTMRQFVPRMDEVAPMPQIKLPAPPCDLSSSR